MRNDILEQAQAIRTSIDNVTGTMADTDAFSSIPSDCKMRIPSALYNNWKAATNWSTYVSKMVSV